MKWILKTEKAGLGGMSGTFIVVAKNVRWLIKAVYQSIIIIID